MYYIYLIVNKINGKTYVGQRKSSKEWYEDKYMGSGKILKQAQVKEGIENFEKFLIQYCWTKEQTNKAERFWIAEYRKRGKAEYNIADGGQWGGCHLFGKDNPFYGHHHSEETKRINAEAHKGNTGEKNGFFGKHHSEEFKIKQSDLMKGNSRASGEHKMNKKHWKLVDGKRVWY